MEVKTMSLRRRASVVAAMGLALWSAGSSAAVTLRVDAQPVAEPIQVFVNVTSSSGAPVTGLQAGDFTVRVDGTTVASPTFSLPPASGGGKVSVVLAMDMSASVKNAALEYMQQAEVGDVGEDDGADDEPAHPARHQAAGDLGQGRAAAHDADQQVGDQQGDLDHEEEQAQAVRAPPLAEELDGRHVGRAG